MLKLDDGRKALYQWDVGVTATVFDDQITQVHFSNLTYGVSFSVDVAGGKVLIPPEVLQSGADVYCWAYVSTDENSYTKKDIVFNVVKRPKPTGYIYTPTDIETLESIKAELLDKINNIVIDADDIPNGSITIDKVDRFFFRDGIYSADDEDIEVNITQRYPSKQVVLSVHLKHKISKITEESANEIPTAGAVIDYVQSVLPPSAEEVEY
jgi:hypothetical protein